MCWPDYKDIALVICFSEGSIWYLSAVAAGISLPELACRSHFINGKRCAKKEGFNEFIIFIIYTV